MTDYFSDHLYGRALIQRVGVDAIKFAAKFGNRSPHLMERNRIKIVCRQIFYFLDILQIYE